MDYAFRDDDKDSERGRYPPTNLSRATINTKARLVTLTNTMPRNMYCMAR
jgi:hypothetical protein